MALPENFRVALLGGRRGLGAQVTGLLKAQGAPGQVLVISRRTDPGFDFSKKEEWPHLLEYLDNLNLTHLWYFAGGGPYGPFQKKDWKDHEWAWNVSFLCPAWLLHHQLRRSSLRQFVIVGSAVAGEGPDPLSSSYASAKHALRGLVTSIQAEEVRNPPLDLRLYSPGYMDTDLLPPSALPRQRPGGVASPEAVAEHFVQWVFDPNERHRNWSAAQDPSANRGNTC